MPKADTEITIATDGFRDYVTLPEGDVYNLGSVSVLKLVAELAASRHAARKALDAFLEGDSAKLAVNLDALRVLLTPKRSRWAAPRPGTSSMDGDFRTLSNPSPRGPHMDSAAFIAKLAAAEKTVQYLYGAARAGDAMAVKGASEALARRVAALKAAAEEQDEKKDEGQKKEAGEMPDFIKEKIDEKKDEDKKDDAKKEASYESLDANSKVAEEILAAVNEAHEGVDRAVAAGKPVNASKAKGDLLKIASRLAGLLHDADLAQPWVKDELMALAGRASTIKGYFQ